MNTIPRRLLTTTPMSRALLITGATGKQGGSVLDSLLAAKADFDFYAVTRDTQSASAQRLAKKSPKIKLVQGNLDDPKSIFDAVKSPIWGVYSVQVAMGKGANAETEERQGKALIDAALTAGVKKFVYSSVDRGGSKSDVDPTRVPHFISKYNVEQHLFQKTAAGQMDWTVLRPVAFFENLVPGFFGKVFASSWERTLAPRQKLQLIATSDIGFFAAQAFMNPEQYKNVKISLAGDELTYAEFKQIFKEKTGQDLPTTYGFVAGAINWMVKDLGMMFQWFHDVGYGVDISSLRKINPKMKDFGTWLENESQFKPS